MTDGEKLAAELWDTPLPERNVVFEEDRQFVVVKIYDAETDHLIRAMVFLKPRNTFWDGLPIALILIGALAAGILIAQ